MGSFRRGPAAPALCGFLALAAAIGIGRFVYTPILPWMAEDLGLDKSAAGLIASANYLGYLAGALAAAAAPGSRRLWLLGASAANALSASAMALAGSLPAFLFLRFAGGAAGAFVMVFASALVLERLAVLRRPGWAALLFAGVGGGIAISALVVSGAAAAGADWRVFWSISGAVCLAALIPIGLLAPSEAAPRARSAADAGETRPAAPGSAMRRLILAYGLFGFGYIVTATFVADMARADPVLRPAEPFVWLCVGLAAAPSVALWTWAGRRWGNGRAFSAACLVEAAGVALAALGESVAAILLGAGVLGGTFVGITALGLIDARETSAGDPRRALALMTASFGLGQTIAPTLAGALRDAAGSYLLPSLTASAALTAAAILAFRPPKHARAQAAARG